MCNDHFYSGFIVIGISGYNTYDGGCFNFFNMI